MAKEPQKTVNAVDNINAEDFKFVQLDKHIFDVKFQSKPTTFFKDALRRFVGNKSSVVAGVLIGLMVMMAVFVPILNESDITNPLVAARFLPPRWRMFEKAGFLDGTIDYEGVVVDYITDPDNPRPAGYDVRAVVSELDTYDRLTSSASIYGRGGSLSLRADSRAVNAGLVTPAVFMNTLNTYDVVMVFNEQNSVVTLTPVYALFLEVQYEETYIPILIKDFSSDFSTITIEGLSQLIEDNKPVTVDPFMISFSARFRVELQTVAEGAFPEMYIDSFTARNVNNAEDDTFFNLNFDSGNEVLLRDANPDLNQYRWRLWEGGSGAKTLFNGIITVADFTYNPYIEVFGDIERVVAEGELASYIANGWMTYDFNAGITSFTITELGEEFCPVREVISQRVITGPGGISAKEVVATVSIYRYYGFTEIPYYLFGTNHNGYDHFKLMFSGLRTSLMLGFFVAIINVFNGMVWGSISGYFGGTVDLVMERFTEILGGVPWIVVMTLAILHLGNNFGVFMLALCLTGWIGTSRVTRSQFYRYKRREYVLASRTLGASDGRLIFRHILPNSIGPIVTGAVLIIPGVIFSEATISYLGLGLQGLKSFGNTLSQSQEYLQTSPYLTMSGALVISILMISFNLFGNGLRDAFNPSLKGVAE